MTWVFLVALAIVVCLAADRGVRVVKQRRVGAASPEEAARLGPPLAAWLVETRTLVARLEVLADHARTMLEREPKELDYVAPPSHRAIRDVDFLLEIQRTRAAGDTWLAAASALPDAAQRNLARAGIEPSAVVPLFELPWGETDAHAKKPDRRDEIAVVTAAAAEAGAALNPIEQTLARFGDDPFR